MNYIEHCKSMVIIFIIIYFFLVILLCKLTFMLNTYKQDINVKYFKTESDIIMWDFIYVNFPSEPILFYFVKLFLVYNVSNFDYFGVKMKIGTCPVNFISPVKVCFR